MGRADSDHRVLVSYELVSARFARDSAGFCGLAWARFAPGAFSAERSRLRRERE